MDAAENLYETIRANIFTLYSNSEIPSIEELEGQARQLLDLYLSFSMYSPLADALDRGAFVKTLVKQYWTEQSVRQNNGIYLVDDSNDITWLQNREDEIVWNYWGKYECYLVSKQGWGRKVVRAINKDSHDILALCGDPKSKDQFQRKGLVVGNVQSGKTANYIGLICRAADAGYRYIVVLAATTDDLRNQTQKRIEEGFIGIDFSSGTMVPVGVGDTPDEFVHPNPGTTRTEDFNKSKMKALVQVSAKNTSEPWVFVVKKNSSTLANLINWLKLNRNAQEDQLFLIDDEADYASINTKARKAKVTKINEEIRSLLSLFPKSVYVGYTATPFANILIDKDDANDELGNDLFPRHFIYTLSASDSYFGASKMFADIEPEDVQVTTKPKYVRYITPEDAGMLPTNAKSISLDSIPQSLRNAIRTFVLASTIRRMRRQGRDTHTSMLVNVSPYTRVQGQLKDYIDEYVEDELRPAFIMYGALSPDEATKQSNEIAAIRDIWEFDYADSCEYSWSDVFPNITPYIIRPLHTILVNSKVKDNLDYQHKTEHVIAIGGYRLSRGLTLEGLLVSYFSRSSRAYDTLLQMSRWFGHRQGYEDICRVWMTEESAGWCRFVSDATDELVYDMVKMQRENKTPLQYGLKVREHPGTLVVTAANKMGAGEKCGNVNLDGKAVETTTLKNDETAFENNRAAANKLMRALEESTFDRSIWAGNIDNSGGYGMLFSGVPVSLIKEFLKSYIGSEGEGSLASQKDPVLDWVELCRERDVDKWLILFAATNPRSNAHPSKNASFECCGQVFGMQRRSPGSKTDDKEIYIGNRSKVSTKGIDSVGLSIEDQKAAIAEYKEAGEKGYHPSQDTLFRERRKTPLLIIHYLDIKFRDEKAYQTAVAEQDRGHSLSTQFWDGPEKELAGVVAWTISFPSLGIDSNVRYIFNKVMQEQVKAYEVDEDEDFEDEDDD